MVLVLGRPAVPCRRMICRACSANGPTTGSVALCVHSEPSRDSLFTARLHTRYVRPGHWYVENGALPSPRSRVGRPWKMTVDDTQIASVFCALFICNSGYGGVYPLSSNEFFMFRNFRAEQFGLMRAIQF